MDVLWTMGLPLAVGGVAAVVAWWAVGVRDRLDTLRRDHDWVAGSLGRVQESDVGRDNRIFDLGAALADMTTRQDRLEAALAHLGLQSCVRCGRWGGSAEMCQVTPSRAACAECLPLVLDEPMLEQRDLERVADWLDHPKRPMDLVDRCIAARPGLWRALKQVEERRRYERLSDKAGTP